MIQSSYARHRSVSLRILGDDQIHEIQQAAFDILEKTGCKILHPEARRLLKQAGAKVRDETVYLPRHIAQEALRTAPKGITIYDRLGNRAMEVEGRKSYYGTSTASPRTKDAFTGEIRDTTVTDIRQGALVADALENIDWVMPMGSCQDVPSIAADLHEFEAVVTHTVKPVVFIGYSARGMEMVYEMAANVAGGMDKLRQKPFLISYPEPITPLVFPEEVVGRMLLSAELEMPQIPGPAGQPGATTPVTLAGTVAAVTAESLMSLTIIQLKKPGTPCFLGANVGVFDMQNGLMCVGAPEMSLALGAQAEVAQSFGLPTWGLAGATDAKTLDAQAGLEACFSILAQGLAGLNLIHDVGYMDMAMVCSADMLVLGDEIIGMAKRFIRGLDVTSETLARDLMEKTGPGGNFLAEDHTFAHFKNEIWTPTLLTRQPYDAWAAGGQKDMAERVNDKLRDILENHTVPALDDAVLQALEDLKQKGQEELVKKQGA